MIAQRPPGYPAALLRSFPLVLTLVAASLSRAGGPPGVEITSADLRAAGLPWHAASADLAGAILAAPQRSPAAEELAWKRADMGLSIGAFEYAAVLYSGILRMDALSRNRPEATLGMGRAVLGRRFPQGAREIFQGGRQAFVNSAVIDDLIFWEGEACWHTNDYEAAGDAFRRLLELYPRSSWRAQALYRLAWVEDRQGDFAGAREHFGRAGESDRELAPSASLQEAWVELRSGHPKEAGEKFAAIRAAHAGSKTAAEALIGEAESAYGAEDFARAKTLYDTALAGAETPRARAAIMYGLAWTALKQRRWEAARSQFQEVSRQFSQEPVAPFAAYRAALCLLDMRQPDAALKDLAEVQAAHPRHEVAQWSAYSTGWIHLVNERFNEAKATFRALTDQYPSGMLTAPAKYLFATALYQERRFREAAREFAVLAEEHPMSGLADGALLWAAWAALLDGEPREAIEYIGKLDRRFPESEWLADGAVARGEALFALEEYSAARKAYAKAAAAEGPARLRGLSGLGWCAFATGDWREAERQFAVLLKEAPDGASRLRARVRLADALFNQKKYGEAKEHYRKVITGSAASLARWAQLQAGWCDFRLGNPKRAQGEWEQLRRRWPKAPEALLALNAIGEALFNQELFLEAESAFRRLGGEAPRDSAMAQSAALRIGDCLYNAKSYESAVLAYRRFTELYPESERVGEALYGMQWAYLQLGDFEKSRAEASSFLEKFPEASLAPEVQLMVAESYHREGKPSEAIKQYRQLLEKFPSDNLAPSARFKIAEVQQAQGNFAEAAEYYEDFLARHPEHSLIEEASFKLGIAYYGSGELEKAQRIFEKIAEDAEAVYAPKALYNALLCSKKLGREEGMNGFLERLKRDYPQTEAAWQGRLAVAYFFIDAGRGQEAMGLLAEIVNGPRESLHPEAACALGDAYLGRDDRARALESFLAGAKPLPKGDEWAVQCAFSAANMLREKGQHDEAVDMFRRVLEKKDATEEQMGTAYCGIAGSYEALGKTSQAKLMYERCLKAAPGGEMAAGARRRIEALKAAEAAAKSPSSPDAKGAKP